MLHIELQPEKEIVFLITDAHVSEAIADNLLSDSQLHQDGEAAVYISPAETMAETLITEEKPEEKL
ncbi:MAG: hypothetical protein PHV32_11150 [Eubacteriales bacterium]|nr:hypothetical protein [Eubacteriales bacterium]